MSHYMVYVSIITHVTLYWICRTIPTALSPAEAEALGLHEAIKFSIDKNMSSVIFESDCKIIVDSINYSLVPQN